MIILFYLELVYLKWNDPTTAHGDGFCNIPDFDLPSVMLTASCHNDSCLGEALIIITIQLLLPLSPLGKMAKGASVCNVILCSFVLILVGSGEFRVISR